MVEAMLGITVFGCGYVGLVTGACLAQLGHDVCCYDSDATRIWKLQNLEMPFYEPGLGALVANQFQAGRLRFTDRPDNALEGADIAFIAVGTPFGPTGEADLTYVRQAARDIARSAGGPLIVVNKSTVPVKTADFVERMLKMYGDGFHRFAVASNPEFLREGSAVSDFLHPDRIVVGSDDETAIAVMRELYASFNCPVHVVDVRTAEMIKYAANAFLATKVSFINEIANICAAVSADIDGVLAGIGADARIGRAYLEPGLGFGGSCLPKDVAALGTVARQHAIEPTMLEATLSVNRRQIGVCVRLIEDGVGDLLDVPIAVAGIAFKGGTDDVRESPAVMLVEALLTRGARVCIQDPYALKAARARLHDRVTYADSVEEACVGARVLVIANNDPRFALLDWNAVASVLEGNAIVDLRNRLDPAAVQAAGLRYAGIGRSRQKVKA